MKNNEKKLKNHPYANCRVIYNSDCVILVSYTTNIIKAEHYDGGYIIQCSGLYSVTTRKHIGYFLREYFPTVSYYDIKSIAGTDKQLYIDRYGNVLQSERPGATS